MTLTSRVARQDPLEIQKMIPSSFWAPALIASAHQWNSTGAVLMLPKPQPKTKLPPSSLTAIRKQFQLITTWLKGSTLKNLPKKLFLKFMKKKNRWALLFPWAAKGPTT